jgi:MFS transporter, CP family, cyanate transporter
LRYLALLWLAGLSLRITVLAVPPLLPQIRQAAGLNEAALSTLTTLPVLLMAVMAPVGSAVTSRLGPKGTLRIGLVVIAASAALRGSSGAAALFGLTFVMGAAIAAVQPAMPALVKQWAPRWIGLATAVYVNGLLAGELIAASLTLPGVLPLTGGWPAALAAWSLPVAATAALLGIPRRRARDGAARAAQADTARGDAARGGAAPADRGGRPARWWPDWRNGRTWRLGLLQGTGSAAYFGANAFLPTYLHAIGHPGLVGTGLTVLNAAQIPASLLLAVLPPRRTTGAAAVAVMAVTSAAGFPLILSGNPAAILAGATVIGLTSSAMLITSLTLPALLEGPGEAPRLSAGMFVIGYGLAFLLPLAGGAAWDSSGVPATAFAPVLVAAAILLAMAPALRRERVPAPDQRNPEFPRIGRGSHERSG